MAGGRPTKYKPEFCETVIKAGEEGATLAGMAEACDVYRGTLNEWMEAHPEFSSAVKRGLQKSQVVWEKNGMLGALGGIQGFNSTAYIFNMKNRFPADWREKQEVAQTVNVTSFKWEDDDDGDD